MCPPSAYPTSLSSKKDATISGASALLVGYEMAGGDAGDGHENIAVAIKAKITQALFGPPSEFRQIRY